MKLVHPFIERVIDFQKDPVTTLVIENRIFFRNFLEELNNQVLGMEGSFILSDHKGELALDKRAFLIMDYYNLDLETNRIKKIIESGLEEIMVKSSHINLVEILAQLERTMGLVALEYDFPLAYKEIEGLDLIKLFKPRLEIEGDFLEKILETIRFLTYQAQAYVIILVNPRNYLDLIEIEKLIHQARLEDLKLLMIENQISDRCKNERVYIIDQDLCEI